MDTQRIVLLVVFAFSLFLLNDAWQRHQQLAQHPPGTAPATPSATSRSSDSGTASVPAPSTAAPATGAPSPPQAEAFAPGEKVEVMTDVVRAEISTAGGDLRSLELLKQADMEDLRKPFRLLGAISGRTYIAQSGLIGDGLPNHKSVWKPREKSYQLQEGSDVLEVKLDSSGGGAKVTKTYRFRRGSYLIEVEHEILADSASVPLEPHLYFQFVRDGQAPVGDSKMAPTFTGVGIYNDRDKFQKLTFEDIAKGKTSYLRNATDGWIAIIQHYFLSAWLPTAGVPREFFTKRLADDLYSAGLIVPSGSAGAGKPLRVLMQLYSGPQDQQTLQRLASKTAPGIDLAVDYGWLTVIAYPLFWVLSWLHKLVGNWGYAIILLTILIKAAFYPLSAASYRSMAKMKVLGPKLQRLKDQYGEDRQRLHQAMMDLYKTEKINPLGGCLPIVVQIPVFIALYWVLLNSIELRQAPFVLWIHDLSAPDPYYILPILMGLSMILQSRLSPTPPDPIQARMMQIMPIVFSVFFFFFPAGLVLYWLVNNVISIAQQWYITHRLEKEKGSAT